MDGWRPRHSKNIFEQLFTKQRPVILIYDGHSSHISVSLIEKAIHNQVVIVKLPPHSSHLLQPMDLCVFKSLKLAWDAELIKWQRQNYDRKLPKATFFTIISKIWSKRHTESGVIEKGGIPHSSVGMRNVENRNENVASDEDIAPSEDIVPDEVVVSDLDGAPILDQVTTPFTSTAIPETVIHTTPTHLRAVAGPSTSFEQTDTPHTKSFEALLSEQVKQTPKMMKTGRKNRCPGAEVITSIDAVVRLKEKANKSNKTLEK